MKCRRAWRWAAVRPAAGVLLVTMLVMVVAAVPAAAGTHKVVNGHTELTVPGSQVTDLTAKEVALLPIAPASFRFGWTGVVSWWYGIPMGPGGVFDLAAHKGTLSHRGGLRFVNVANGKALRLDGLRLVVRSPSAVTMNASVGDPPATRADVMVATNSPHFTRQGKYMTIDGVEFRLTQQAVIAVQEALGVTLDTTTEFADADVEFRVK